MNFKVGVSFKIKNDLSEIAILRDKIELFCKQYQLQQRAINSIKLSMDEILTNVISYSFKDKSPHEIIVRASLDSFLFHIEIEDDGFQFNPLQIPEPDIDKPLEDRQIGGLGVYLVRKLMDCVEYRRENGRNILIMKKNISIAS